MKIFCFICAFLFVVQLRPGVAAEVYIDPLFVYRPPAKTLDRRGLQVEALFSRLISQGNFNFDGGREDFVGDETFEKNEGELKVRFGLSERFEITAGARYRQNYALDIVQTQNSQRYTLKRDGLESGLMFIKYNFWRTGRWVFTGEGKLRRSIYHNPLYSPSDPYGFLVLGDGGTEFSLGGHLSYTSAKKINLSGSLFYNIPNSNLSDELVYDVQLGLPFTRLALVGGIGGVFSLQHDEYSDIPRQKPPIGTANTNLFNSVNRSWTAPYAGFQFALHPSWRVDLYGKMVMMGVSTDRSQEVLLQLVWGEKGISKRDVQVHSFKDYTIEASVVKVSPRGKFVRVDKGISQDIEKGMRLDIYQTDYFGGNVLLASGIVYEAYADSSILKIETVYREDIAVKEGHVVRGAIR